MRVSGRDEGGGERGEGRGGEGGRGRRGREGRSTVITLCPVLSNMTQ